MTCGALSGRMPQNKPKSSARGQGNKPRQTQAHVALRQEAHYHEGPIPPPTVLEHYDAIVPGAAERIIAMAEGEIQHRRAVETQQVNVDIQAQARYADIEHDRIKGIFGSDALGQKLGACVSCVALLAAAGTAVLGVMYPPDSVAYWTIPVACVSLPVLGMVQAITAKRAKPPPMDKDLNG